MSDGRTMRAFRVHQWGDPPDALSLDTVPVPDPGPGELRVRVQAIPLNLNDVDRVTGANMMVRPELPCTPGMEVMGVVDACGDGVEDWQERRVVAMPKQATGGFAELAICPVVSAFEMPESVPLPDVAGLYFPFHLAWLGLFERAALVAGESVLIHAAAGGVGSAALQLAVDAGARVFATAGSSEKRKLCEELGAEVAIDYTNDDFAAVVMERTRDRGVDVVFDGVGEAVMARSMDCIAYDGRYLMVGFASDKRFADEKLIVPRRVSAGNFKLCGVLLAYAEEGMARMMKKATGWNFVPDEAGERINREIVSRVEQGRVRAVVGRECAFEELPQALADLAGRRSVGRTVVRVG
jgi:NADPH2:quinone reductase